VTGLPIKDEQFSAIRDRIVEAIKTCSVIYYRPHEWTPAFRIELPGKAAKDKAMTSSLLGTVRLQCASPGSRLPYPLKRAEDLTRQTSNALHTINEYSVSSALKHLSDLQDSDDFASLIVSYNETNSFQDYL
jgi:hypothetical protein